MRPIKQPLVGRWAHHVMYRFIRAYSSTFRLRVEGESEWLEHLRGGGRVLLCGLHQQFFSVIRHFAKLSPFSPALMISQSQDGDIIAGVARLAGWCPIRGSSSSRAVSALKGMIDHLTANGLAGHIVDGPRGPAGSVKPGTILLAAAARAAIVPYFVVPRRAWVSTSWDRFFIPLPFSRVTIHYGSMIAVPRPANDEEFEAFRRELESLMTRGLLYLPQPAPPPTGDLGTAMAAPGDPRPGKDRPGAVDEGKAGPARETGGTPWPTT